MKKNITLDLDLKRATGLIIRARRAAAFQKRDAGEPRNPARAKPGQEKTFQEAGESVRAYDAVLNLIEKEVKAERLRATYPARAKARRFADRALDFIVGFGIVSVAALGVASALLLLRAPDIATRAAAFAGVTLILSREVASHWKRK